MRYYLPYPRLRGWFRGPTVVDRRPGDTSPRIYATNTGWKPGAWAVIWAQLRRDSGNPDAEHEPVKLPERAGRFISAMRPRHIDIDVDGATITIGGGDYDASMTTIDEFIGPDNRAVRRYPGRVASRFDRRRYAVARLDPRTLRAMLEAFHRPVDADDDPYEAVMIAGTDDEAELGGAIMPLIPADRAPHMDDILSGDDLPAAVRPSPIMTPDEFMPA